MDREDIKKVWAAYQEVQEKAHKKMDPVGQEDDDIDNDGDTDKSDEYLHNRRKAIKKAMKEDACECEDCNCDPCNCNHSVAEEVRDPNAKDKEMMADRFTASDKRMADGHGGIDPKPAAVDGMKAAADTAAAIKASEPGENHKNRPADKSQGDKAIIQSPTKVKEAKTFPELMKALMDR